MKAKNLKSLLNAVDPECDVFFKLSEKVTSDKRTLFAKGLFFGWEDINYLEEDLIEYSSIGHGEDETLTIKLSPAMENSDIALYAKEYDDAVKNGNV